MQIMFKKVNGRHPNKAMTTMLLISTTIFFTLFQLSLWIPTTISSIVPDISESPQFRGGIESATKDMILPIWYLHACDR